MEIVKELFPEYGALNYTLIDFLSQVDFLLGLSQKARRNIMRQKIFLLLLIILTATVLLSSCNGKDTTIDKISNKYKEKISLVNDIPHLKYKLQNKLIIDADINYNEKRSKYNSYQARLMIFDKKSVRPTLMPEHLVKDEFHKDAGEPISRNVDTDYYFLENKDGASLGIGGTMLYYEKPEFDNIYYAFKSDTNSNQYNADKYKADVDLSFMSKGDAFNKVKSILSDLKIKVSDKYTCYALDNKTMTNEYHYVSVSDDDIHQKTHTFSKDDECYCFLLNERIGDLQISEFSYGDSDAGTYVPGTEIEVFYGKKGLIMLSITSPYEAVATKNKQSIINLDNAIDKFDKKYKKIIITDKITVNNITLSYTASMINADKNEYTLTPAWVFDVTQKFKDHKDNFSIMFDAFTGEELV